MVSIYKPKTLQLGKNGLRKCHRCKNILPLTFEFFYHNNSRGHKNNGFGWSCKKCQQKYNNKNRSYLRKRFTFLKEFGFACQYCGRKAPEVQFHIDHIFPKSKGGKSIKDNLTLACDDCNLGKGDLVL